MSEGKVIFDGGIKSQSIEAVKGMIEFFDGEPCLKLPAIVQLADRWQLTKSSKGDEYYLTSPWYAHVLASSITGTASTLRPWSARRRSSPRPKNSRGI